MTPYLPRQQYLAKDSSTTAVNDVQVHTIDWQAVDSTTVRLSGPVQSDKM